MAFRIPDFTALPELNPRPSGQLPVYPQEDPGAAGLATFGKGLSSAGGALVDIAASQRQKQNQVNAALAEADLSANLYRTQEAIKNETDPAKIDALKAEIPGFLDRSAATITDPEHRQLWMAKHQLSIVKGQAVADERQMSIYKDTFTAGAQAQIDEQIKIATTADDPAEREAAKHRIGQIVGSMRQAGVISATKEQAAISDIGEKLIEGHVRWLDATGNPVAANELLKQNQQAFAGNPGKLDTLATHLRGRVAKSEGRAAVDGIWAPDDGPRASGGMRAGGATTAGEHYSYLTSIGASPNEAALLTSAAGAESGFDPTKTHDGGIGYGLYGHNGERLAAMRQSAGSKAPSWQQQAKFALSELRWRPEGGAVNDAKTPEELTDLQFQFERPKRGPGDQSAARLASTREYMANPPRGALAAVGEAPSGFDQAIGDSIAVQQVNHGVGGSAAPFKSEGLGPAGTTARVGDSPDQVLQRINTLDNAPSTVFLSSGASNNPDQAGYVGDQIDALKAKGATNIVVPGVGPGVKNAAAVNASLKNVVESHGGIFFVPEVKWQKDGVHPAEVDKVRAQGIAALSKAPTAGAPDAGLQAEIDAAPPSGAPIPLDQAAGGKVAPDFDRMLTRLDGMDFSTEEARNAARAELTRRYSLWKQQTSQDRAVLKSSLQDGLAMLQTGRDWTPDRDAIKRLLPREEADTALRTIDEAQAMGDAVNQIQWASPAETVAAQARIFGGLNDPKDFARKERLAKGFAAALTERTKQLNDDPAAYVSQAPTVAAVRAAADPNNPQSTQAYISASLAEQERMGVLPENRRVLTKQEAAQRVSQIRNADPGKMDMGLVLDRLATEYGPHWNAAFGDLVKAGLPQTAQTLATMTGPDQAVARQDYQRMIQVASEKGGMAKLKDAAPKDDVKVVDDGLDERLKDFRLSVAGDPKLYDTVQDSVRGLAYYYALNGQSGANALDSAYKAIIDRKYDFDGPLRVPKGQLTTVESAGDVLRAGIKPEDLGAIPGNPNLKPEERQSIYMSALARGFWMTNERDDGAVLMLRLRDNAVIPARRKDGSRVEFKFSDAPALVKTTPSSALLPDVPLGAPQ